MNNIIINQNNPDNIKKLEAMRRAYSYGKNILLGQLFLTGPVTIIFAILKVIGQEKLGFNITSYAAMVAGIISILDILLNISIAKYKSDGAKIQEQFDCDVYGMEWNSVNAGSKVSRAKINKYASNYVANPAASLMDWYPIEVQQYSLEKAIFICQKEALRYDRVLRNKYRNIFMLACIMIFILLFAVGLKDDFRMQHFFIQVIVPFLPVLIITIKIVIDHNKSIRTSTELHTAIEKLDFPGAVLSIDKLRMVQDKIYCSRKDSPLIPDFFYFYHRQVLEDAMHENAESGGS